MAIQTCLMLFCLLQVREVKMSMMSLLVVHRDPQQATVPPGHLCHQIRGMGQLSLRVGVALTLLWQNLAAVWRLVLWKANKQVS